jgi:tetratricopeptide (TPR) repeat protein
MSLDDLINQLLDEKAPPQKAGGVAAAEPGVPNGGGAGLTGEDAEALAHAQSEANRLRAEVQKLNLQVKVLKAENEALMANAQAQAQAPPTAPEPAQAAPFSSASVPSDAQFPWKRHIANVEDNLRKKETSVAECALKVLVDVAEAISIEPAARARLLTQLGTVRIDQGQYAEAEQTLNTAIQLLDGAGIGNTMAAAYTFDALAQCQQSRDDFAEAEKLRRKAVVIAEEALGAEHPDVGFFRERLESLRAERALFDIGAGSETVLDKLNAEYQALLAAGTPPEPPVCAPADGYMMMMFEKYIANAKTALAQKNAREAESYLKSAMEKAEGVPNNDPRKCESMRLLGQTLETQNKDQEAKALYEQALVLAFKYIGWNDVQVAYCLQSLAQLHNKLDDFGMAKNYYRSAVTNFTATLGKDNDTTKALEEEYQAFIERVKSERKWKGWSN